MKLLHLLVAAAALTLMGAGAAVLLHLKTIQRLGEPGVKWSPRTTDLRLDIPLPARVLDYESKAIDPEAQELEMLPQDTSLARRLYEAPDGFKILVGVVLMGTDRTSIHKPEFCLPAQGWQIVAKETRSLSLDRPRPYVLPLGKFVTRRLVPLPGGGHATLEGVYIYWFVSGDRITASHWGRMGWITWDLLQRGVLPRWAYLSAFAECPPGQQAEATERVEKFLAAAVPEFQVTTGQPAVPATADDGRR